MRMFTVISKSFTKDAREFKAIHMPRYAIALMYVSDSIDREDISLCGYGDKELNGKILLISRIYKNFSQAELSKITGIPKHQIDEIEKGVRMIGTKHSKIFAKVFEQPEELFL